MTANFFYIDISKNEEIKVKIKVIQVSLALFTKKFKVLQ